MNGNLLVRWFLSLRLPPRRPLDPSTSVVIRELVDIDDALPADREALSATGGRAIRNPVALRDRFAETGVSSFLRPLLSRFDMRGLSGVKKTRVHQECK